MKKFITLILCVVFMISLTACKDRGGEESSDKGNGEVKEEFIDTLIWNDKMMEAYLKPYWESKIIYNETATFVGEEAEATLLYTPTEVQSVRSYDLLTTYKEGKDYVIEGNKIKRVKGGAMPYWEVDEYFRKTPNFSQVPIQVDSSKCEFDFEETRYLYYGEGDTITQKQIAVTYRHNDEYDGPQFTKQAEKLTNFLAKVENKEDVSIMVYGDSVAVGCNASGTEYGGYINPLMPSATQIVQKYLQKRGLKVNLENQATGGWKVADCINHYDQRIKNKNIDLLILRIGGNDGDATEEKYKREITELLNMFFADHPEANVILQTPELPNQQSTWTLNVDKLENWALQAMETYQFSDKVAVARVQSFTNWVESRGKRTRDWLANNINHSNDFIIRSYAQIILTTMFGEY